MAWVEVSSIPLLRAGYYVVTDGTEVWPQHRDEFGWAAPDWLRGEDYQQVCELLEQNIKMVWEAQPMQLPEPP